MGLSKWLASEEDVEIHRAVEKIYSRWLSKSGFYLIYSEDSVLANYAKIIYYALSGVIHFAFISIAIIIVFPDLGDMFNQIHIISLLFLSFSIIFSAIRNKKNIEICAKLIYDLEIEFENMKDDYLMNMKKEVEFYKRIVVYNMPMTFVAAWFLYVTAGIIASLIDGVMYDDRILRLASVNTYWPAMGGFIIFEFILPNVLQILSMFYSVMFMSGGFIFYLITMIYFRYYLSAIKHRLMNLDAISRDINKKRMEEGIVDELRITQAELIKQIVQYHITIKKCSKHFNESISTIMQFIFLSGGIDLGLSAILILFYEGNLAYKLEAIVLSIMELCIFTCLCFSANHIGTLSEEVSFSFYSAQWFDWSPDVKKMMIIVMSCSQKPIKFNAGPMFTVDVEMFASLIQSTYSVINLYIASKRT